MHCMLQGLTLRPPSLHLSAVILLRRSKKVLTKSINLDVFRPNKTTRALGEANLTHELIDPVQKTTSKTTVKLLSIKWLQRQFALTTVRYTHGYLTLVGKHRTWCTHTWVRCRRCVLRSRYWSCIHYIATTVLSRWIDYVSSKSWSSGTKVGGRRDIR